MAKRSLDFERFLGVRSAGGPSFSPDGRRVAFLADITGVPEVWAVDAAGGWPDQLTYFRERVLSARYSPTAERMIIARDIGGNERAQLYDWRSDSPFIDALTQAPNAIHSFGAWSPAGDQFLYTSNARNPFDFDVRRRAIASGADHAVIESGGWHQAAAWQPDSQAVLVQRVNRSGDMDLLLVDLATGAHRLLTPHVGFADYASPRFSADGQRIWCLSDQDSDYIGLGYVDVAAGGFHRVVALDWDIEELALAPKSGRLAYLVNEDGYSALHLRDIATGLDRVVDGLPPGVYLNLTFASDEGTLALAGSGPRQGQDIWLVDYATAATRQLTRCPDGGISRDLCVDPLIVRYPTFDGRQIPAFLFAPNEPGPHPCLVWVHGGPESQLRPAWNPVIQYLVHRGYAVFAPNVRGSTGYGKAYCHLDDQEKRLDAVADLDYGWQWLANSGLVDPSRIAVMGGSYGGFMTLSAVTEYPDRWAGAVDIVGIANFETFFERTGPWRRAHRASEYGDPVTQRDLLRRISPIHQVDRITAPLMVLHGRNDPRVPVEEAELIVNSMRQRGRDVEYLCFEDEGHGFVKLANRIEAYTRIAAFLDRYVARRA